MNARWRPWLLAAVAVLVAVEAILLLARRQELQALRKENRRRRTEATAVTTPAITSNRLAGATPLSAAERLELLRLRGEVQPLREELRAARGVTAARVAPGPKPGPKPDPIPPSRPAEISPAVLEAQAFLGGPEFAVAGRLAQSLRKFIQIHEGAIPADWEALDPGATGAEAAAWPARFELMRTNPVPPADRGHALVAREKKGRQLGDGSWIRVYLVADGGTALAGPIPEPDWPYWERFYEANRAEADRRSREAAPP